MKNNQKRKGTKLIFSEDELIHGDAEDDKAEVYIDVDIPQSDNKPVKKVNQPSSSLSSGKVKCGLCNKSYANEQNLRKHFHSVHVDGSSEKNKTSVPIVSRKPIKCPICGIFRNRRMKEHLLRWHKSDIVKCTTCGQLCTSQSELDVHSAGHLSDICCDHCTLRTKSKQRMYVHIRAKHFPKTIQCPECPIKVSTIQELNRHKQKAHNTIKCPFCSEVGLKWTIKNKHMQMNVCKVCAQEFPCLGTLREHRQTVCSGSKACKLCGKRFFRKENIVTHMLNVHPDKRKDGWLGVKYKSRGIKCVKCKRYFNGVGNLNQHNQFTHNTSGIKRRMLSKRVFCDFCGCMRVDKKKLLAHFAFTHGIGKSKSNKKQKDNRGLEKLDPNSNNEDQEGNIYIKEEIFD